MYLEDYHIEGCREDGRGGRGFGGRRGREFQNVVDVSV
jgi:hypothetical protein